MSRIARLTTTSYAILGMLAIRPWTSYELTRQMDRSLRRFWPRAQSKLYEEPKKLVDRGLATATTEHLGRRRRERYTITAEGRAELARWLTVPPGDPVLQAEHLVRVFLAEHGSRADLLATLAHTQAWAQERLAEDAAIAQSYLTGEGPYPERAAQLALVGRYLSDFAEMTAQWARWAGEQVEGWPEDASEPEPAWDSLREIASRG